MYLSYQPIKNNHVMEMFKSGFAKNEKRSRVIFMHKTCFLNGWDDWEDYNICMKRYNPDFERLYHYYKTTNLVPYFNTLTVTFVRHIDEFIEMKKSIMFVVHEDLLYNWQK